MNERLPERREVDIDPNAVGPGAQGTQVGFTCARCKCPRMGVGSTVGIGGGIRRYRYCENCGRGLPTEEIAKSELEFLRRQAAQFASYDTNR